MRSARAGEAGLSKFRMDDLAPEARKARLDPKQGMALAKALELATRSPLHAARMQGAAGAGDEAHGPEDVLRDFLLPFAEFGLDASQMLGLLDKVSADWPLSHRDIYYDFRLGRWQKHIEPPTIAESLDEYLENSPSREEGLAYLRAQWKAFLQRNGAA